MLRRVRNSSSVGRSSGCCLPMGLLQKSPAPKHWQSSARALERSFSLPFCTASLPSPPPLRLSFSLPFCMASLPSLPPRRLSSLPSPPPLRLSSLPKRLRHVLRRSLRHVVVPARNAPGPLDQGPYLHEVWWFPKGSSRWGHCLALSRDLPPHLFRTGCPGPLAGGMGCITLSRGEECESA